MRPLLSALLVSLALAPALAQSPPLAIPVKSIDTGAERFEPALLVLGGGKIIALGARDKVQLPEGARDLRTMLQPQALALFEQLHVTLPLIDANSRRGADGQLRERPFAPGLAMTDALDPFAAGWSEAREAGVGYAVISPDVGAVLGGRSALVSLGAARLGLLDKARAPRHAAVVGALNPASWNDQVVPSGRAALLAAIERQLTAPQATEGAAALRPDAAVMSQVRAGKLALALRVASTGDARGALALFERHKLRGVLLGGADLAPLVEALAASKDRVGVVLDPLSARSSGKRLRLPAALAAAGVPFAFSSAAPQTLESGLIDQAALACFNGLPSRAAWAALTINAHRIFASDAPTALAAGGPARLVFWRGDPARFMARPVLNLDGELDLRDLFTRIQQR